MLSWLLLVHLPAKDKQLKELLEHDEAERGKTLVVYATAQAAEREICRKGFEDLASVMREMIGRVEAHHAWAVGVSATFAKVESDKKSGHA